MSPRPDASPRTPLDAAFVTTLLRRVATNSALPEQQRLLVQTTHAAALRPSEAAALTVGSLDADRCALRITDAKTGTLRLAPLPASLYRQLARASADAEPAAPLFGDSILRGGQPCARRTQLIAAGAIAASMPQTTATEYRPTLHDLRKHALTARLRHF